MSKPERKPSKAQIARHASRELAVQALYQWQLNRKPISAIEVEFRAQVADDDMPDHENWVKVMEIADLALFHSLLHGVARDVEHLDATLTPLLDRDITALDAIELSVLRLGVYELKHRPEVPYRAVINEAVELAKAFGASDGHKYVNSVLDKLSGELRPLEVGQRRR